MQLAPLDYSMCIACPATRLVTKKVFTSPVHLFYRRRHKHGRLTLSDRYERKQCVGIPANYSTLTNLLLTPAFLFRSSGDIAVAKWERWVNATVTRYTDYIDEWEVG